MHISESIHIFPWTSPDANNCTTFFIDGPKRILVDPGLTRHFHRIQRGLEDLHVALSDIDYIVLTHLHPDHFEAIQAFRSWATPLLFHQRDWELIREMEPWLKENTDLRMDDLAPHHFLVQGPFPDPEVDIEILHTPGHSPGSITLFIPKTSALITGDALFKDGVGRTDLPGGNGDHLKTSIKRLAKIPAGLILPGHGEIIQGREAVIANFERIQSHWFPFI